MARSKHNRKRTRRSGGGFSTGPESVAVGYAQINPYSGAGKDCPVDQPAHRFGEITSYRPMGLPGMSGGGSLAVAGQMGAPLITVDTTMSMPGVPTNAGAIQQQQQKGGAYSTVLSGPLSSNGVGGSALAGVDRISCSSRYPPQMQGGGADVPRMEVGAASDMAVYRAANAGYTNQAVSVPGSAPIMAQVGYPAGSFNRACMTTGGGKNLEYADLSPVSMKDLGDRAAFNGTHGGLPVRFGGRRRSARRHSKRRHSKRRHSKRTH